MLKDFRKYFILWYYNLKAETALRQSFLMLVFGMVLNDVAFVAVWVFFFQSFGSFNGWQASDALGLEAMAAATYGLGYFFAAGPRKLPRMVDSGYFDNLLLTPGNLHLKIFAAFIRPSAIGDIIFGTILSIIYFIVVPAAWWQILAWFLVMIPGGIIVANFALFASLISFWVTDSDQLSYSLTDMMINPSLYPSAVYNQTMRFIFIYILPALAVGSLPVEAFRQNNYLISALVWALAFLWIAIANISLRVSVKHYESANLVANRV